MPLYMDRHRLADASAEDVAHAHALDLAVEHKHEGVHFHTYWFDARACTAFCLIEAPSPEALEAAHRDSHGLLPAEIIEVDPKVVEAFMGRIVDPPATPINEAGNRVVMFTDIVNSTELTGRLGDHGAMDIIRAHDMVVRRELAANEGREVKHLGDGIMASFSCAQAAVAAACAILKGVHVFNGIGREPLHLRIGLHVGEPVAANNDLFGSTVQMAARICADASVDAIVVSDDMRVLIAEHYELMPLGKRMLKGFREPAPLYAVEWQSAA